MTLHTYSISFACGSCLEPWILEPYTRYYVTCSCGIESGQSHPCIGNAHLEPKHSIHTGERRGSGYPLWDGTVEDNCSMGCGKTRAQSLDADILEAVARTAAQLKS